MSAEAKGAGGSPGTDWGETIFGLAFALLFCAFGLGASWLLGHTVHDAQRAGDWVPAQATVNAFGDGTIAYQYKFGGAWHGGDRLGAVPFTVKGNVDTWDAKMTAKIASAYASHEPITVWVNPRNPDESMVNRDMRWPIILLVAAFALGFGGIGLGVLWVMLRRMFGAPAYGRDERSPVAMWVVVLVLNAFTIPLAILALQAGISRRTWELGLDGVVLLIFGAGAIRIAIRASRKTGDTTARASRPSDPMVRYRQSKAAGAAAAAEARRALVFMPRFMMSDRFPYIVFGGAAAVIIVIGLMILIFGTGHA